MHGQQSQAESTALLKHKTSDGLSYKWIVSCKGILVSYCVHLSLMYTLQGHPDQSWNNLLILPKEYGSWLYRHHKIFSEVGCIRIVAYRLLLLLFLKERCPCVFLIVLKKYQNLFGQAAEYTTIHDLRWIAAVIKTTAGFYFNCTEERIFVFSSTMLYLYKSKGAKIYPQRKWSCYWS